MLRWKVLLLTTGLAVCNAWTVTQLATPPLDKIKQAISTGLAKRYEELHVEILEHPPNLKRFGWMLPGLGEPTLLDFGSTGYLKIAQCHNSTYNMTDLAQKIPEIKHYLP